jgi:hypothetical protein
MYLFWITELLKVIREILEFEPIFKTQGSGIHPIFEI